MNGARFDYSGKVVIVTGATSGIGRDVAAAFVEAGAHVVLSGRRAVIGEDIAAGHRRAGGSALFVAADVAEEDQVRYLVERTVASFGRLDAAFNNAGVIEDGLKPLHERSRDDFDRLFAINVRGVFLCMKYQIPAMLAGGGGAIVNNASVGGLTGVGGIALYCASKHAVIGMTKATAVEQAAHGIRINALLPDATESEMIEASAGPPGSPARDQLAAMVPMKRIAKGSEQAGAVLFLCSPLSSFMTGSTVTVDGGRLAGTNFLA